MEGYDGGASAAAGVVRDAVLQLGPHYSCTLDLYVVDIANHDIFLGMPWHEQANPLLDFTGRRMWVRNTSGHLVPFQFPNSLDLLGNSSISMIGSKQFKRATKKNCTFFLGTVRLASEEVVQQLEEEISCPDRPSGADDDSTTVVNVKTKKTLTLDQVLHKVPGALHEALQEFKRITKDQPPGRPPDRDCPMHLDLEPGKPAPKHVTYRMSAEEMEGAKLIDAPRLP